LIKGPGKPVDCSRVPKDSFDRTKAEHFIDFLTSPAITVHLPFGMKKVKLSTGEMLKLSNTCRSVIPSRLIRQYQSVCQDEGFDPFKESTLFAIIAGCASNIRHSLSGLDNFSADGSNAFQILSNMMDELVLTGQ
jgi:hypothetical protein